MTTYSVSGRQSHDARLVAAMNAAGIQHILMYNGKDFARYPMVTAVRPQDVTL